MNKITIHDLTTALHELGQILGGTFTLDEEGSCLLTYRDSLPILIQFVEEDGRVVFASELKAGLENASDSEWLKLLSIDWLGIRASGCALSPDKAAGCVVIWRDFNANPVNGQAFAESLDSFIEEVIAVREFVENPSFESSGSLDDSHLLASRA
jgi:hypothetical protein